MVVQFSRCLFVVCLCQTTHLLYHTFLRLSTPFQKFFEDFFELFSEFLVCYKLFYYTTFFFVCQAFFRTFSKFLFRSVRFLNFSLVRYFLLYHFFFFLSRGFRDKFLLFLSFALLNYSRARSLIPKFPALFRFS